MWRLFMRGIESWAVCGSVGDRSLLRPILGVRGGLRVRLRGLLGICAGIPLLFLLEELVSCGWIP